MKKFVKTTCLFALIFVLTCGFVGCSTSVVGKWTSTSITTKITTYEDESQSKVVSEQTRDNKQEGEKVVLELKEDKTATFTVSVINYIPGAGDTMIDNTYTGTWQEDDDFVYMNCAEGSFKFEKQGRKLIMTEDRSSSIDKTMTVIKTYVLK